MRIGDFYPTLVVVTSGIVCGTVLLAAELVCHKARHGTYWPGNARKFPSMDVTPPTGSV